MGFGFVLNQRLQLMEGPSVKTASNFFAGPNPFSDIRQIFHNDCSGIRLYSLLNHLLAHYVINMLDTAGFLARDFLQKLFGRLRIVGLKTTSFGQKFMSFMTDFSSAKKFSTARCSKNVFTKIYSYYAFFLANRLIRQIQDQIEVPVALPKGELGFFGYALRKIDLLKGPHLHFNTHSPLQGIERKGISLQRIGSFIKMDASVFVKTNHWYILAFHNALVFIRLTDGKNRIANHLGSQLRGGPDRSVANVMEGNTIPTSMLNCKWNNLITTLQKLISQRLKLIRLIFSQFKFYTDGPFHSAEIMPKHYFRSNELEERQFLPVINDALPCGVHPGFLAVNKMKMELNEEHSTLYDLLRKASDPRHEISTVVDKGPDGKELFYSNRILLERLKLINSRGYITEIANKILQNGTKLNSSHPDGSTRVVITYTEFLSRNSPQETKQFLTSEELEAMDLDAPHFETGRLYAFEGGREISSRTLGRRRREE